MLLVGPIGHAEGILDSLQQVLTSPQAIPEARLAASLELARHTFRNDPRASQGYARQAIALADQLGDSQARAKGLGFLAVGHSIQSAFDSASQCLQEVEQIGLALADSGLLTHAYANQGIIAFRRGQMQQAIDLFECGLAHLAPTDRLGRGRFLNNLGNVYQDLGDFDQAIACFDSSLALKRRLDEPRSLGPTLVNLAMLHFQQHDYRQTLDLLYEARQVFQTKQDRLSLINLMFNLGAIYEQLEDCHTALGYYRYGIDLQEDMGMTEGRGRMLASIGRLEAKMGQVELGMARHEAAMCLQRDIGDSLGLAKTYASLAELMYDEGLDTGQVATYARQALQLGQQGGYWQPTLTGHYHLARLLADQRHWAASLPHTEASLAIVQGQGLDGFADQVYRLLAEVYAAQGDTDQAYRYERRAREIADSLDDTQALHGAIRQELDLSYQVRQAQLDLELLQERQVQQAQLARARSLRNWLLVGLVLLVKLAVIFYVSYLQKQRHNQLLHQRTAELREKNRDLLRLHEEKNQLIGVLTHDLRTPVTQIQALNQQLCELHPANDPTLKRFQQAIGQAAGRLSHTIDRILDLNSLETRGVRVQAEQVFPAHLLHMVADGLQASLQQKNLRLFVADPLPSCQIWADPNLLREIFENLLSNAIKFSPPGSKIEIGGQCQGNSVRSYVRDYGPGIHPDDMPKLFGKYQKLRTRPTQNESSTGLGLAIVKGYVERMDGRIWCESEWGQGATFWVEFACTRCETQPNRAVRSPQVFAR